MAEQQSDDVNTTGLGRVGAPARGPEQAAGATEVALSKAELLATAARWLAAIVVGTLSAALFWRQDRPDVGPQAGPRALSAATC
jgi:hypothetical protein